MGDRGAMKNGVVGDRELFKMKGRDRLTPPFFGCFAVLFGHALGGCLDDVGDLFSVGDEDDMTALYLGDMGVRSFTHDLLKAGGKGVVFGSNDLPAGFRAPGRIFEDIAKDRSCDRHLGVGHEVGSCLG